MNDMLYAARLREVDELVAKNKSKFKHIEDPHLRGCAALLSNNQIQYNDFAVIPKFIKQISVPATIHTISAMPNMFGVQAVKGDSDICFYLDKAGDPKSLASAVCKTTVLPSMIMRNINVDLDAEELAFQCVELAVTMADDTVRVAVEDIIRNAGYQLTTELYSVSGLIDSIQNASNIIKESIGRPANFVVMPVVLARFIKTELATEYDFDALPTNIRRVGCLKNKWIVYINGYESRKILVGYRGSHPADAGYVVCPYLLFCNPKKEGERYLISRQCKNLMLKNDYYACIELTADKRSASMEEF